MAGAYEDSAVVAPGSAYAPSVDNLLVWIPVSRENGGTTLSSGTFGATSLNLVSSNNLSLNIAGGGDPGGCLTYLVSPGTTSETLDATWASTPAGEAGVAITLSGIDPTTPIYATIGDNGATYTSSTNPSLTYDAPVESVVVYWRLHCEASEPVWTDPTGFVARQTVNLLTSPQHRTLRVWTKDVASAEDDATVQATTDVSGDGLHGFAVFQAEAASGADISATLESLSITEFATTIEALVNTNITATLDSLSLSLLSTTVQALVDVNINATLDTLSIASFNPTVEALLDVNINASLEALALSTFNSTVSAGVNTNINATLSALSLSNLPTTVEHNPGLEVNVRIQALNMAGNQATIQTLINKNIAATLEGLTVSSLATSITVGELIEQSFGVSSLIIANKGVNSTIQNNVSVASSTISKGFGVSSEIQV